MHCPLQSDWGKGNLNTFNVRCLLTIDALPTQELYPAVELLGSSLTLQKKSNIASYMLILATNTVDHRYDNIGYMLMLATNTIDPLIYVS